MAWNKHVKRKRPAMCREQIAAMGANYARQRRQPTRADILEDLTPVAQPRSTIGRIARPGPTAAEIEMERLAGLTEAELMAEWLAKHNL